MRKTLIAIIRAYQKIFSPDKGMFFSWRGHTTCRFYPTCSEYMILAIEKYGSVRGAFKGIKRIARCNPFGGSGVDMP